MSLINLIDNNRTDKNTVHSYLGLYEELFSSKKETATNVLEVGIYLGGSIKLWSDYFKNATVHGLDVMNIQNVWDEIKNKEKIVLHTSTDAYSENFFNLTFSGKRFDMMLDDGPHTLESMKQFIKLYSQLLTVDGILVIEDVQSWDWIEILKNEVPSHLKSFVEVYDLRLNKNRYDDIVFVINKSRMKTRNEIMSSIVSNIKDGVFVEIGTHSGHFADSILSQSEKSILYCVDPYTRYNDYKDAINDITGDDLFNLTKQKLTLKYGDRVKFVREFSSNAVNLIPDNIDFLYIDGNHQYDYVYNDLVSYFPKVKPGGIILGDDAVDTDDTKRNNNKNVYIEWSPGCYGEYGVIKAFTDFKETNKLRGHVILNQYLLMKE